MLHLAIPLLKPAIVLGSTLKNGGKRQAELRQRRREAGWVETLVWVPRMRAAEIRAAVEQLVGKPPKAKRRADGAEADSEILPPAAE